MENFQSLGLPQSLIDSLTAVQFHKPTPIQKEAIPHALKGRDVLGSAQTGTGKTGAYGIPLISYLMQNPQSTALILTPTRELAIQVLSSLKQFISREANIRSALLIGGEPMFKQLKQLRMRPRLVVGTPGRVIDHLSRSSLRLTNAGFLVVDETDRMLDMGFEVQLQKIVNFLPSLPKKRQTLMFSATMTPNVIKMAKKYLTNEVRVRVGSTTSPIEKIVQDVVQTTDPKKYEILLEQLERCQRSFIVFVKTKWGSEKLAKRLRGHGHEADAIHGDLRQRKRDNVIAAFRNLKSRILVATDVAARGLDIPHVSCVINYDLPQCPEDYIHRIGRTGRAGAQGRALSFVTAQDAMKWRNINKLINPSAYHGVQARQSSGEKSKKRRRFAFGRRRNNRPS